MIILPGYHLIEKIYEGSRSIVYRGYRVADQQPIVAKTLRAEYPTSEELSQLQYEYEIIQNLGVEGVIKALEIEHYQRTAALIVEDFGGGDLKQLLTKQLIALPTLLEIATAIAGTLGKLHQNNVIHKDIKPANIIVNLQTKQVKLIDFGLSTRLSRANQSITAPGNLEGTLAYISPEQTGRMNRAIDYRTDFYSFGVTLYEMLTGSVPFRADDPMEQVYCHIAKIPEPPHLQNPDVPEILSQIVLKLLSKNAEDRYCSAYGLKQDLRTCLEQLQNGGSILPFPLAQQDISDKFEIPQKLYGREVEVTALLSVFEQVSAGSRELMLVSGYSGIGKSMLVNEIHKPIVRQRGYFISGKFDQFQRNIPYSAPIQAFQELVRQILSESGTEIETWKSKLLATLGSNGQVIIDVIPQIELIIGPQPPVPELSPAEAQNRFNLVFRRFIRVFAQQEHPLAIFLDDLQWADSATLKLIDLLMTDPDTNYLFIIGAYRDNEVDAAHPLMLTVESLQKQAVRLHSIQLAPLNATHLTQLLADTLKISAISSNGKPLSGSFPSLADLVHLVLSKTGGNPFFVNQFLRTLYEEKLLEFDFKHDRWRWDLVQIQEQGITDNVVELMAAKLRKLAPETQEVLKLAACIGNEFTLKILAIVYDKPFETTIDDFAQAVQEGLIKSPGDFYKNAQLEALGEGEPTICKFLHDRVQQAAYSLISEADKKPVHLKIGRLFLEHSTEADLQEQVFAIVGQLNGSIDLISDEAEQIRLAELNLIAGKKAKESTAYKPALEYLNVAITLLSERGWDSNYQLTFSIYQEAAECEYLCSNFDKAEALFNLLLANCKSNLDKAIVYNMRIVLCENIGKFIEGIQIGKQGLSLFGLELPDTKAELQAAIAAEFQTYKQTLGDREISSLIDLPRMTHADQVACIDLLMNMCTSAFFSNPDLLTLTIFKAVNISLTSGNASVSPYAYVWFGALLGPFYEEYKAGYEFGQLALQLNANSINTNLNCKLNFMFSCYINHWRQPSQSDIPYLRDAYQFSIETGDINYGGYSLSVLNQNLFSNGEYLNTLIETIDKSLLFFERTKTYVLYELQTLIKYVARNLQGFTQNQFSFSEGDFDEQACIGRIQEMNFGVGICLSRLYKMYILFTYENYAEAAQIGAENEELLNFIFGFLQVPQYYFYHSLALTALYPSATVEKQTEYQTCLNKNQAKMKTWADNCPENFQHKYLLVEAELARLRSQTDQAMELYDQAIEAAHQNQFLHDEALANELAAKFYAVNGYKKIAQPYMRDAHYLYGRWGATRKVRDLEEKYPNLLARVRSDGGQSYFVTETYVSSSSSSGSLSLDASSVIKASQALSGEIDLAKLLKRLMTILFENAGAQKGFLILPSNGELKIEAAKEAGNDTVSVMQSLAIEASQHLSTTIVRYVERTQEDVVLGDATQQGMFTTDPYVIQTQPKSVLCAAILNQGKLVGIVYLENNLTIGAFTPERLEVLRVLSAQAAISLENALLYQTLEQKVEERTVQLALANDEILALNGRLKAENLRMSAELDVARQLQLMILPKEAELEQIEGLEIAGFMAPADEVGGDYYDVLSHNGQVKLGIGDVTGHGLESGVLMLMVQTAVRTLLTSQEADPIKFLDVVNRTIYDNVQRMDCSKTLTLSLFNYQDSVLELSGQHEEVIVVRRGGIVERIDTLEFGFPIGLEPNIADFIASTQIKLETGDVVVLYTDGITEAENMEGVFYGIDRLCEVVKQHWDQSALEIKQALVNDIYQHIGSQKIYDDITFLILKQKPTGNLN